MNGLAGCGMAMKTPRNSAWETVPCQGKHAHGGTMGALCRFLSWRRQALENRMRQLWTCFTLLAALSLLAPDGLAAATAAETEQAAPQGEDPPGADNGATEVPPPEDGVIPPPDVGDEGIHTEVPDPGAGHEEEVIPPPDTGLQSDPNAAPR
jgi:hypothetical protein